MADPRIEKLGEGDYRLSGPLTFPVVAQFFRRAAADLDLERGGQVRVDLSGLSRVDSAGLALLVEWLRIVHNHDGTMEFRNVPQQLASLVRVSGLTGPFGLSATAREG